MSPQDTADRLEIMEQLYRYCRSVDRLDVPLGHGVFHEDSVADFPAFQGTGREWIDFICVEHLKFLHHSHQVTNVVIDLDGDRAGSEAYVTARLRRADGDRVVEHDICARYVDRWSRRDGRWAIDRRECIVDFAELREVQPLPGDPRSARDSSDPSHAVLKGLP